MQNDSFILYFNLTLIIPAIICFIRLKNIPKEYLYFFIFLFAGFLNESIYLINISTKVNTISTIVYSFIETQCLAYIFCKWRNFNLKYTRYLQIGLFFSWITGHIIQLNASEISIDWFNLVNKIVLMYITIEERIIFQITDLYLESLNVPLPKLAEPFIINCNRS